MASPFEIRGALAFRRELDLRRALGALAIAARDAGPMGDVVASDVLPIGHQLAIELGREG
ncbi:MAG: hypothetical protein ABMB14_37490 [Myxococcota bacterium]